MPFSLYLAPLHGVTNHVFRGAFFKFFPGFDAAYAPFIGSAGGTKIGEAHFKDLSPGVQSDTPLVPQILGNQGDDFLCTAERLIAWGYTEINWNLGCPFPMVANKQRGSGLLPYPDKIRLFLDQVCPRLSAALSIKVRLGRTDPAELLALMPIFNEYPLARVIIHPRIGVQMYEGEVDLKGFERAASLCRHPVAYNGDITDAAAFASLRGSFPGVKEWMIGRGAIRDPFLPQRLKGISPSADPLETLRAFHLELYTRYRDILHGPRHVLDKMKEIWTYLRQSFPDGIKASKDIIRAKDLEAYENGVEGMFESYAQAAMSGGAGPRRPA